MKTVKLIFFYILSLWNVCTIQSQNSLQFNSLDSLFKFAEQKSSAIKTSQQQSLLAKWTKITSYFNTVNVRSPFTASWTNNTQLPVSYLPAEAFGGPAGTLKAVSLGQQYVSSYAITPQIDIINPSAWTRVKSAEINKQLTEVTNSITKKNLFESVAATYYNIVSIQYQIIHVEQHVAAADSLTLITKNKFQQGIIREQDMNNVIVNSLTIQDKLTQLKISLDQNYNSLKILCDIKPDALIKIVEPLESPISDNTAKLVNSTLLIKQAQLQSAFLHSEMNATRWASFSPTLSLVGSQAWQQNSNLSFSDAKANKFTSQYFGLRLSVPFPLDANRLSQNYTAKINYKIAGITAQHSDLQSKINDEQLDLDRQKAFSTYSMSKQISELKDINYQKYLNQFIEGILTTDILLTAFADRVNAKLNYSSSIAALKYSQTKINLNNTIR